jgi:outer membrane protein
VRAAIRKVFRLSRREFHLDRIGLVVLLSLFAVLPPVRLLGESAQPRILSLQQALEIAAEKNRDILKAKEYRNYVMGKYKEERAAALPQFSLNASSTSSFDNTFSALFGGEFSIPSRQNVRVADVSVTQAIYTWGQVGAALRAAKSGFGVAAEQLRLYQQAVARDVSTEFYNVLLAKELYAISQENLRQRERHLEEAKRKYAVGVATDYDVLAGEVAMKNAQPPVIRSENLIRIARERLRFLLAVGNQEVDALGKLEAPVEPVHGFEETFATALISRPELSDLMHRIGISRELVKIASADDKPRVDFNGRAGLRSFGVGPFTASGETWSAAITVSFPFFDGLKARGRVQQAQSDLMTLQIEQTKTRDSIAVQVREALDSVRENGEIVKGLMGTVSEAERLLWMAEKGFELGAKTRLEVDDAQSNVVQAKGNLARGQHDYLVARVALESAQGTIR